MDVAVADQDADTVTILLANAAGGLSAAPGSPLSVSFSPRNLAVGDFNNDGIPDLMIEGFSTSSPGEPAPGILVVWLGLGNGTFAPSPSTPVSLTIGPSPAISLSVGDFNSDGKLDIALVTDISAAVLVGDGQGGFFTVILSNAMTSGVVQAGDFNGDGVTEFALINSAAITVWSSNGQGGFTSGPSTPTPIIFPYYVLAGDFNGDGNLDLALAAYVDINGSQIQVLLGDGHGAFTAAPAGPTAVLSATLAAADFNGDGRLDLLVISSNNGVTVLLGDGAGGFTAMPGGPFPTGTQPLEPSPPEILVAIKSRISWQPISALTMSRCC